MKTQITLATILIAITTCCSLYAENAVEYRNPVSPWSADAWDDYGFGDPFVMRYNGRYYLYPSTRDDSIGVKCWSSVDLVNWKYEGLCATDPTTKGAYAPEVFHANDAFYMITSPAGRGHYIYRGPSPTGPFERATENFGLSIDGTAFIDDDGSAYFYSASDRGILAYRMTSPTEVAPEPIEVGASMRGWTEGPGVFKHDGTYYLTYTGNHVFSRGYRIDGATGDSPLKFRETPLEPIAISTEGPIFGVGHNSVVKGPNLDLYYMVYHTLNGRGKIRGWPVRETNLALLSLNGETIGAETPSREPRKVLLPDAAAWFDSEADLAKLQVYAGSAPKLSREVQGAIVLTQGAQVGLPDVVRGDFTAEFDLAIPDAEGVAGVTFCRQDEENYALFEIERKTNSASITFVEKGKEETTATFELPKLFNEPISFTALRSIQIERHADLFTFYIDDRLCYEEERRASDGSIGYCCREGEALCGFLGVTNAVKGRSAQRLAFNVAGRYSASRFVTRDGAEPAETFDRGRRVYATTLRRGDALEFAIDAEEDAVAAVVLRYASKESCAFVLAAAERVTTCETRPTENGETTEFECYVLSGVALKKGVNKFSLSCENAEPTIVELETVLYDDAETKELQLNVNEPAYSDGQWNVEDKTLVSMGEGYGKRFYGDDLWRNYRVDVNMTLESRNGDAGVVVRATQPALGGPNNSAKLGTDFFFGYYVGIRNDRLVVERRRYNSIEILAEKRFSVRPGKTIAFGVVAYEKNIVVELDGERILECEDDDPLLVGRPGVRASGAAVRFDDMRVSGL